jgi:hypothetical protein
MLYKLSASPGVVLGPMGVRCVGVIGPAGGFKSPALTHTAVARTPAIKTEHAMGICVFFMIIFLSKS